MQFFMMAHKLNEMLGLSGILVLLTFGVTFGTAVVEVGLSEEAAAWVSDISSSSGLENLHKKSEIW